VGQGVDDGDGVYEHVDLARRKLVQMMVVVGPIVAVVVVRALVVVDKILAVVVARALVVAVVGRTQLVVDHIVDHIVDHMLDIVDIVDRMAVQQLVPSFPS
jgi:hypothetical protein